MMKYKLIALDMDGTLLTSEKGVHPDTIRDIARASGSGIHVVYCSGRGTTELMPYVPLLPTMRYAVCMSGAMVYDFKEERSIYRRGIAREYVKRIMETAAEDDGMVHFLTDNESIALSGQIKRMADFHMGIYQSMFEQTARGVEDLEEEAKRYDSFSKVNIYFRSEEARRRGYETLSHLPLAFAFAEETSLEMTAEGVTKASGLKALADHLGVSMAETMSIGDADNDRAVLEAAGFSVAMGNANEDIRKLCDAVTKDNDHNGVGEAIRKYCF